MPYTEYVCTEVNPIIKSKEGVFKAIFDVHSIWAPSAVGNITLTFGSSDCPGCSPTAAWSLVGSKSDNGSRESPSMNLGFIDPPYDTFSFNNNTYDFDNFRDSTRNYCEEGKDTCKPGWVPGATVIHEFCHALGMLHEHQNNLFKSNSIKLNKEAVIRYYQDIGMTAEDAKANVLTRYDCGSGACDYVGSEFDPKSIMLYALPDDWVEGPNPTKPNFTLSALDKEWLGKVYPSKPKESYPQITVQFIDANKTDVKWKQAWVAKCMIEQLLPLVYVGMRFVFADGKSITYTPTTMYVQPSKSIEDGSLGGPTMTPTSAPTNASPESTSVDNIIKTLQVETFRSDGIFSKKYFKGFNYSHIVVLVMLILVIILNVSFINKRHRK
jgi:hypothetical protein